MSVQLATRGEQDVYITGKPDVTYFKSVYKRFTPFYKQTYEIPLDGQGVVTTGFTSYCTLPDKGDIITKIYLKTVLPLLYGYYQLPGTRIISEARLTVGSQVISTLTGAYIDLENNMNTVYENQVGLTELLTQPSKIAARNTNMNSILTELDFGIVNIPIHSLDRHDVIIEIDFNPGISSSATPTVMASMLVEYAKISTPLPELYVYKSTVYREVTVSVGDNEIQLDNYIKNYVRDFYITLQSPSDVNTYTYTNSLTNISLNFNGEFLIDYASDYFSLIQPFESKMVTPTRNVYTYTFHGPVNFSRISKILLTLTSSTGPLNCVMYFNTLNVFIVRDGLGSIMFA